jgi:hypothetical protein
MIGIVVKSNEWNLPQQIDRDNFNNYIREKIANVISRQSEIEKVVIDLPASVTKLQRYNIHRLSILNHFNGESRDDNYGNRIMIVTLSKSYVQELFENYQFAPEVVPKTEKEILFDNFIKFIEQNFQTEFENYLNNM